MKDSDPRLAAKAAYLAGTIRGDRSDEVLEATAASQDALVHVAAASAAALLGPASASQPQQPNVPRCLRVWPPP
jgi:hypothetical protein